MHDHDSRRWCSRPLAGDELDLRVACSDHLHGRPFSMSINLTTPSIPDYRAIAHFETNFDL
jgi:hypothetical protein